MAQPSRERGGVYRLAECLSSCRPGPSLHIIYPKLEVRSGWALDKSQDGWLQDSWILTTIAIPGYTVVDKSSRLCWHDWFPDGAQADLTAEPPLGAARPNRPIPRDCENSRAGFSTRTYPRLWQATHGSSPQSIGATLATVSFLSVHSD